MYTLSELLRQPTAEVEPENRELIQRLVQHDAQGLWIPARFEEQFYLSVNLPEQLGRLFRPVRPYRIDEDLLEELCQKAGELVRTSILMDDLVQQLYRVFDRAGLNTAGARFKRPDEKHQEVSRSSVNPNTANLQALKRLWAYDWHFEQVLMRLDDTGKIGLDARPVLGYLGGSLGSCALGDDSAHDTEMLEMLTLNTSNSNV